MTSIQEKIVKPKLGLLELAKQLGSVSQACPALRIRSWDIAGTASIGSRSFTSRAARKPFGAESRASERPAWEPPEDRGWRRCTVECRLRYSASFCKRVSTRRDQ